MGRLSHPYMTTRKTTALTIWTFISKVIPLISNLLSRFVTAFLPRSKCLSIPWLQSLSAVILEPKKRKRDTLNMPANLESSAVATGLVKVNFLSYEENQKHLLRNTKSGKVLHLFHLLLSNSPLPQLALCPGGWDVRKSSSFWLGLTHGSYHPGIEGKWTQAEVAIPPAHLSTMTGCIPL